MMKVCYSEMDTPAGLSCRLEADGHAGYAPAGQDIVCAGASTVMQGLAKNGCAVPLSWPKPALCCWPNATRRMSALQM